MAVERLKLPMDPAQVEHGLDLAHEVIIGDHALHIEIVEKLALALFPPPHHGLTPRLILLKRRNHGSGQGSTSVLQHVRR